MSESASPVAGRLKDLLAQLADELKARGLALPTLTGQWTSFARFWRGGWRSTAAWVCVLAIIVNAIVLPVARLFGFAGEPLSWEGVAALVTALGVLAHYRSKDLNTGVTS